MGTAFTNTSGPAVRFAQMSHPSAAVRSPYTLKLSIKPGPGSPSAGLLFVSVHSTRPHVSDLTFKANVRLSSLGYVLSVHRFISIAVRTTREYTCPIIDGDEANSRCWYMSIDIWGDYMALGDIPLAAPP